MPIDKNQLRDETKEFLHFSLMVGKEKGEGFEVPEEVHPLLKEFIDITSEELLDGLPPTRDIQHCFDLVPSASLQHLYHHRMGHAKHEELHRQVSDLMK